VTRRILVSYLMMTLFILVMLIIPLGRIFSARERDRLLTAIERDSRVLAAEADDAFENNTFNLIPPLVDRYVQQTGGRVVMVDAQGQSVIDSDDRVGVSRDFSTRPEIVAALKGQYSIGERSSATLGGSLVYVAVPVVREGAVLGAVRVSYPTTTVDQRTRQVWIQLISLGGIVLAVVGLAGWFIASTLARPVRELEATADTLAAGELSARVAARHGPPDLLRVARAFNTMADANQGLIESQRAFLADASHQLRTPLTALRLRLEGLSENGGEVQADRSDSGAVEAAMTEVDRLSELVDALLAMARLDAKPGSLTTVDVGVVAAERAVTWSALADERDVAMVVENHGSGGMARVVEDGLEQMLDNLIANAIEVSSPGSTITIEVDRNDSGSTMSVVVSDEGPGLSESQMSRAFDRFWRGPNPSDGGSGLGLAIVRRLAETSGGSASMELGAGGGLQVRVTLPVATRSG